MSDPKIRPEVVSLLADIVPVGPTSTWKHNDGRPVTAEELALVMSANFQELEAVRDYSQRAADYATEQANAVARIGELAAPYFAQLPAGARMGAVMAIMSAADRRELMELMELVAPDGSFVLPSEG